MSEKFWFTFEDSIVVFDEKLLTMLIVPEPLRAISLFLLLESGHKARMKPWEIAALHLAGAVCGLLIVWALS